MAQKGVWRAGTETPLTLVGHTTKERYERTVAEPKNAYENKVPPRERDREHARAHRARTRRRSDRSQGDPLESIDALRDVRFVMKDGVVFKQHGVMTPEKFFHGGPVNGWNIR